MSANGIANSLGFTMLGGGGGMDIQSLLDELDAQQSAPPAPAQGGGVDWGELIPQLLSAFSAGQAIRQRDPSALSNVVGDFARTVSMRRRDKLAGEGQQLREQREQRLAEYARLKALQDIQESRDRNAREQRTTERAGKTDLDKILQEIQSNARTVGDTLDPAALEAFLRSQSERVKPFGGNSEETFHSLQPFMFRKPQTEQVTVRSPEGKVVSKETQPKGTKNIMQPRPRVPREGSSRPIPQQEVTPEGTFKWLVDPQTFEEIPGTRHKVANAKAEGDPLDALIKQVLAGSGGGGAAAAPTAAPAPRTGRASGPGAGAQSAPIRKPIPGIPGAEAELRNGKWIRVK